MSMNKTQMKDSIKAAIEAIPDFPAPGEHVTFTRDDILEAFCGGIISHIQDHATVEATGELPTGMDTTITVMGTVE